MLTLLILISTSTYVIPYFFIIKHTKVINDKSINPNNLPGSNPNWTRWRVSCTRRIRRRPCSASVTNPSLTGPRCSPPAEGGGPSKRRTKTGSAAASSRCASTCTRIRRTGKQNKFQFKNDVTK